MRLVIHAGIHRTPEYRTGLVRPVGWAPGAGPREGHRPETETADAGLPRGQQAPVRAHRKPAPVCPRTAGLRTT